MTLWQKATTAIKKKVKKAKESRDETKKIYDKAYKSAKTEMIKKKAKQAAAMRYFPSRARTYNGTSPLQQMLGGSSVTKKRKKSRRKRRKRR